MKSRMNGKQRLVVVLMDILLLAELAVAIYLGQRSPDDIALIFLKTYLPAMLVTVVLARICIKRLGPAEER
jgi:hypothetical protein